MAAAPLAAAPLAAAHFAATPLDPALLDPVAPLTAATWLAVACSFSDRSSLGC
jgi:hypothetical protein